MLLKRSPSPSPSPSALLPHLATLGCLGLGVSRALGGHGGTADDLHDAVQALWLAHPAAAATLRAQRLAIEALVLSPNVGLREYLLPQLLSGERAASLPGDLNCPPLVGTDTGRGWHLNGLLPLAANLRPEGFTFVAPIQLGHEPACWVVLRGEEDGLDVLPPHLPEPLPWARACALGDVRCRSFRFREDEWLAGANLTARLMALDTRLRSPPRSSISGACAQPPHQTFPTRTLP